jgi:hypothetical protein
MQNQGAREASSELTKGRLTSAYVQIRCIFIALLAAYGTLFILKGQSLRLTDLGAIAFGFVTPLVFLGLSLIALFFGQRLSAWDIAWTERELEHTNEQLAASNGLLTGLRSRGRKRRLERRIARYERERDDFNKVVRMMERNPDLRGDVNAYLVREYWVFSLLLPTVLVAVVSVWLTAVLIP